jgi:hypothetical protein
MRHDSYMLDYSNSVSFNAGTSFILRLSLSSKHHRCAILALAAHHSDSPRMPYPLRLDANLACNAVLPIEVREVSRLNVPAETYDATPAPLPYNTSIPVIPC